MSSYSRWEALGWSAAAVAGAVAGVAGVAAPFVHARGRSSYDPTKLITFPPVRA